MAASDRPSKAIRRGLAYTSEFWGEATNGTTWPVWRPSKEFVANGKQ